MVRTAATIRLQVLRDNLAKVMERLKPGVDFMAVLKADAYGHGARGIFPVFRDAGVKRFAVAIAEEGADLRNAGCEDPILILGDTLDDQLHLLVEYRLTPAIFTYETASKLNDLACAAKVIQPIHIKIDTGMSRIGFRPGDDPQRMKEIALEVKKISLLSNLEITGCFTHFAKADEEEGVFTAIQADRFSRTVQAIRDEGVVIPMVHMSNSPALLLHPGFQADCVRAGDVLYGLNPVDDETWPSYGFRNVMIWSARVVHVKEVPAGTSVGYGGTFVTERPTVIATVPVGFADGYSRRLSNLGYMMIHGQRAPILGRVCMDQTMVDVTDIPGVKRGDEVMLLDDDQMSIQVMANLLNVNVDEIVCGISKRVPRVYE